MLTSRWLPAAGGKPVLYCNTLDVAPDTGVVYFSDSMDSQGTHSKHITLLT